MNMNTEKGNGFKEGKNFFALGRSRKSNKILYSSESFDEFPNLWIADPIFDTVKKITKC